VSIIFPEGITARGKIKLKAVLTMANTATPALATEINAASSLDVSCFVYGDGWAPNLEQNKVEAPLRLCTKRTVDKFGNVKFTLQDLHYVVDPQGAPASNNVKAYETLTPGLKLYFVERQGLDAELTNYAVGQFVNVHPIELGPERLITGDPSDEANEFMVIHPMAYQAPYKPTQRVAIVT
jgi:hypothetical protein